MSRRGPNNTKTTRTSTRTKVVLAAFVTSMTAVTGMLLISGEDFGPVNAFAATKPVIISDSETAQSGLQTPPEGDIDGRWEMIVIHDSGSLSGTVRDLDAEARQAGLNGLGYHFVIGNGNGLSDGVVEASYRWNSQLAGAHVAAAPNPDSSEQLAFCFCDIGIAGTDDHVDRFDVFDSEGHGCERLNSAEAQDLIGSTPIDRV